MPNNELISSVSHKGYSGYVGKEALEEEESILIN